MLPRGFYILRDATKNINVSVWFPITYCGTTKQNVLVFNGDYFYLPQILAVYVTFFLAQNCSVKF